MMRWAISDPEGDVRFTEASAEQARATAIGFAMIALGSTANQAREAYQTLSRSERVTFWKGLQLAGWSMRRVQA